MLTRRKTKQHRKQNIWSTNKTSHEDFMKIINEEKNHRELKESIRMMKS